MQAAERLAVKQAVCSGFGSCALNEQLQDRARMRCLVLNIGVMSVRTCRRGDSDLRCVRRAVPLPRGMGGSTQQLLHRAAISSLPGRGTHVLAGTAAVCVVEVCMGPGSGLLQMTATERYFGIFREIPFCKKK
jgi:hypothetical protein